MKSFARKKRFSAGFTLPELLAAVLVLVMITAGIMPAALNAYQNAVDAANAHALLTETINALRSELSTAWDVHVDTTDGSISYKSASTGGQSKIYLNGNEVMLQEYAELPEDPDSKPGWYTGSQVVPSPHPLISDKMKEQTGHGKSQMIVEYSIEGYPTTDGYITIQLQVKRSDSANPITKIDRLVIRTLGGEKTP